MKEFEGLCDLHNHLMFGVDDGAENSSETEAMLLDAVKNNVKVIVATPHTLTEKDCKYQEIFQLTESMAARYDIQLLPGAEYSVQHLPENPPYITLGGKANGAVLVDFKQPLITSDCQAAIDNIFSVDCKVIVAHPERSFPRNMLDDLNRLAELGVVYQLTAASILGVYGKQIRQMCWTLLENGWAKIIASDAHDSGQRANLLLDAYEIVARRYGRCAAEVLQQNARNVLENPGCMLERMPVQKRLFNLGSWLKQY